MTELAIRYIAFGLHAGEVVLSVGHPGDSTVISGEFCAEVEHHMLECERGGLPMLAELSEGVLRINGQNRTVVYRLDEYNWQADQWSARLIRHVEHEAPK